MLIIFVTLTLFYYTSELDANIKLPTKFDIFYTVISFMYALVEFKVKKLHSLH